MILRAVLAAILGSALIVGTAMAVLSLMPL